MEICYGRLNMTEDYGFVRISLCVPKLRLADVSFNVEQHVALLGQAIAKRSQVIVFPELSLTGYTCGDLFHQRVIYQRVEKALLDMETISRQHPESLIVLGAPVLIDGVSYNCAAVFTGGQLAALVPKIYLPNYDEFKEKIYFSSGPLEPREVFLSLFDHPILFGKNIILQASNKPSFKVAIEMCEDLWAPNPTSTSLSLAGATILLNLSASNELVGKVTYRRRLVRQQSERCIAAYCYVSSGPGESTMDLVFGGHALIYENGCLLGESSRFQLSSQLLIRDVDVERLISHRARNTTWADAVTREAAEHVKVLTFTPKLLNFTRDKLLRTIDPHPFVPSLTDSEELNERCEEILKIQAVGLAMRMERANAKKLVIGLSGGLDSTHALLVCLEACRLLEKSPQDTIVPITMPGFGTTEITKTNVHALCHALHLPLETISINDAVSLHLKSIKHDGSLDVTYENAQARERYQILFDKANQVGGIVVGTGDLSELALGWMTYGGDHLSSYAVNVSVPKSLIRFLIEWYADNKADEETQAVLMNILATPITPELLPPSEDGSIRQKTEEQIGPYELHDFFLYHFIRNRFSPRKVLFLATNAFRGQYPSREIKKWLIVFITRFFANQFKRSCMPDGPKVGTVSLSPRGEWRMPTDASARAWLEDLE